MARICRAISICPAWSLYSLSAPAMKSSYDSTISLSITDAFTAHPSRRRAWARFTSPMPVITAVPFVSASPSRMRSLRGVMPHAAIASAAGTVSPRNETSA